MGFNRVQNSCADVVCNGCKPIKLSQLIISLISGKKWLRFVARGIAVSRTFLMPLIIMQLQVHGLKCQLLATKGQCGLWQGFTLHPIILPFNCHCFPVILILNIKAFKTKNWSMKRASCKVLYCFVLKFYHILINLF